MLNRMRHPRHILRIAEATHGHIHSRRRLVRVGIMYEERLKLVGQLDDAVCSVVEQWLLELICQALDA